MKCLSAAIEVPTARLIWLCEGLVGLHTPALPRHRAMLNAAKAARKFSMSGDLMLAQDALNLVVDYTHDGSHAERVTVRRRVDACHAVIKHRLATDSGGN